MEKDATKTVIKALKTYLHEELPPDKDFFHELDSRGLLASNTAREIAKLADQGMQDCVWKLVTFIDQFYTEEMLQKLCVFLEEYAKPARPKLATIASRIRQEISKHVSLPVPEYILHHSTGVHDAHAVPSICIPEPPPPYTPTSTTLSPGTVPGPAAPGKPMKGKDEALTIDPQEQLTHVMIEILEVKMTNQQQVIEELARRVDRSLGRKKYKAARKYNFEQGSLVNSKELPRNWKESKRKKELPWKCDGECYSIAVQGDAVFVGVERGVLHIFSKMSGAQVDVLRLDQGRKGSVYGVAFIDEDTIVVSDDKKLTAYTTKGQFVRNFPTRKSPQLDNIAPRGLTVSQDGRIFVCDFVNHCVYVFNVGGDLLFRFGSYGSGDKEFNHPRDVCMGGEGLLFITDLGNNRICVYTVEGAFIREFPTPREPTCVAATHCSNHLVVSLYLSNTVMIMTTDGQLVNEFGGEGSDPGQFTWPRGVAVDKEDCVYVCDGANHRVQVY